MVALLALLALVLLFPLVLLMLVPFGFALASLGSLLTLPGQLFRVATDGRRRRNHALEHATVHVLEERYGARLPLSGMAEPDGFVIQGAASPEVVRAAAEEGLRRLASGERDLALHPRCGTVLVAGQLVAAVTFFAALVFFKFSLAGLVLAMFAAILAARLLARPLGMLLQRVATTSTDVSGLRVDRLDAELPQSPFQLLLAGGMPTRFRIWTQEVRIEPVTPRRFKAY